MKISFSSFNLLARAFCSSVSGFLSCHSSKAVYPCFLRILHTVVLPVAPCLPETMIGVSIWSHLYNSLICLVCQGSFTKFLCFGGEQSLKINSIEYVLARYFEKDFLIAMRDNKRAILKIGTFNMALFCVVFFV